MTSDLPAGRRYLRTASDLLTRLETTGWPSLEAAADLIADAMAAGGTIHVFGSGHSHMLAEELFYRAGGFVRVRPDPVRGAHAPRERAP